MVSLFEQSGLIEGALGCALLGFRGVQTQVAVGVTLS